MIVEPDNVATARIERGRFIDQPRIYYASLVEDRLRARFGEVEEDFVDCLRCQHWANVVGALALVQTLAGAYRIWRAERRGKNRPAVLRAADRRIVTLEEDQ